VLLAMLADDDVANRKVAINIIQSIRKASGSSQEVREFLPPQIKENAQTLRDLLPPKNKCTMEPPLTKQFSIAEKFVQHPQDTVTTCHSQGVEHCVKMVTEVSSSVYGIEKTDGYIRAVIKSRDFMPSFETKQDFNTSFLS
jgi:hypothetical protein